MGRTNWKDLGKWNPTSETIKLLDAAMQFIKSVPYHPSSRWVFYRLLQHGLIPDKSYITKFDYITSRARHQFYGGWRPDTLADSIRQPFWKGELLAGYNVQFDSIEDQDCYVQLWYEARAMHEQFSHYSEPYRISLVPFGGEISISMKWQMAKKLEEVNDKYGLPIIILYFGDLDPKGLEILQAALRDVKAWCKVPFNVERVGLTLEQVQQFHIPEQPNKPGNYQWEAVEEKDAAKLIMDSLNQYVKPVSVELLEKENTVKTQLHPFFVDTLNKALGEVVFQ